MFNRLWLWWTSRRPVRGLLDAAVKSGYRTIKSPDPVGAEAEQTK